MKKSSLDDEVADLLRDYPPKPHGFQCGVSKSGQHQLVDALVAAGMTRVRVAEILFERKGIRISHQTIQRHCRGMCACQKS